MLSKYDTASMVLVFDETTAAEVATDLIEALIVSGEPFKTLQTNRAKD